MSNDEPLSGDERRLFNKLIVASGKLATAADQANVILSEQHEDLTRPFIEEVRHILGQCEKPAESWDGTLHDEDMKEKIEATGFEEGRPPLAVTITHIPTGISRESRSQSSQDENRDVAKKALLKAVGEHYKRHAR